MALTPFRDVAPTINRSHVRFRRTHLGLLLICALFLIWRTPFLCREPGWQDEEVHAAPGLTILQSGVPRLPHLPSRNRSSPYYRADEAAFLEPPLFFYATAAFYAVLPHTYGTARLVSALAGVTTLVMLGRLTLRCGGSASAALWGTGLFMMSRWFYFPACAARPDLLCTAFGLIAVLATETWTRTGQCPWFLCAGIAIGCGGLTHPFALAYAVQMAVWVGLCERRWRRVLMPIALAATSLAVASVWLILIAHYPDIFAVQFRNQFIHERGGSLMERVLWPWESLAFHAGFLRPHMGWWQFLLPAGGAIVCLLCGRKDHPLLSTVGWLAISGAAFISVLVGPHHPVFGYFSYPAALAFVGVGWGIDAVLCRLWSRGRLLRVISIVLALAVITSLLVGSRVRMNLAYVRRWNDIEFDGPRFARHIIEQLPRDAVYLVDEEFILDFLAAGRHTIATRAIHEDALPSSTPYDYRIESRSTDRYFSHVQWSDSLVRAFGDPNEPYGCFARIYRSSRVPESQR